MPSSTKSRTSSPPGSPPPSSGGEGAAPAPSSAAPAAGAAIATATAGALLRRTGGTEGYYRQQAAAAAASSSSLPWAPSPSSPSSAAARRGEQQGGAAVPSSQVMDERRSAAAGAGRAPSASAAAGRSYLMPPGELGKAASPSSSLLGGASNNNNKPPGRGAGRTTRGPGGGGIHPSPSGGAAGGGTILPGPCAAEARHRWRRARRAVLRARSASLRSGGKSATGSSSASSAPSSRDAAAASSAAPAEKGPGEADSEELGGDVQRRKDSTLPRPRPAGRKPARRTVSRVALSHYAGAQVAWVAARNQLVAICAQTQYVLQEFDLSLPAAAPAGSSPERQTAPTSPGGGTIVALVASGAGSGVVAAVTAGRYRHDGGGEGGGAPGQGLALRVLAPARRDSRSAATGIARCAWTVASQADLYPVFYDDAGPGTEVEDDGGDDEGGFPPVTLSLSASRLLVGHRSQVAVVDVGSCELLWTTRLGGASAGASRARIGSATLSGDGEAIALTLQPPPQAPAPLRQKSGRGGGGLAEGEDDDDDEYAGTGVYTFERDPDDGADSAPPPPPPPPAAEAEEEDGGVPGAAPSPPLRSPGPGALRRASSASRSSSGLAKKAWGVVYRPSPFLVQNARVAQLSFRGLGHEFSSYRAGRDPGDASGGASLLSPPASPLSSRRASSSSPLAAGAFPPSSSALPDPVQGGYEGGCDLLLVAAGSSVRVYTQNAWRLLLEWTVVPRLTRVDFVPGAVAMTLGDLEGVKPRRRGGASNAAAPSSAASSAPSSRRPSMDGGAGGGGGGGDVDLTETIGKRGGGFHTQHYQSVPSAHNTPLSNAGAWVSEITVEPHRTTIQLSRITFLKRGMDDLSPTLFENVSTVFRQPSWISTVNLPPSMSTFAVQGVWPAWNPWPKDSTTLQSAAGAGASSSTASASAGAAQTLRGSAMAALGLSQAGGVPLQSPSSGRIGDPLLAGSQTPPCQLRIVASQAASGDVSFCEFMVLGDSNDWTSLELSNPRCSSWSIDPLAENATEDALCDQRRRVQDGVDLESSRLLAHVDPGEPRTVRFTWRRHGSLHLLPSTWMEDVDPATTRRLLRENTKWFKDESMLPVPCTLPPCILDTSDERKASIVALKWWPDAQLGDAILLLVLENSGTLRILEVPPPWTYQEPMTLRSSSATSDADSNDEKPLSELHRHFERKLSKYDVLITPHPEYGLGLRLEANSDGEPAIAGSFKRHPLTGESLPAEKTGMVTLGDEIVSADGVSLEGKAFDDIIATVRDLGATNSGQPMRLTFRRKTSSLSPPPPLHRKDSPASPSRRTVEEIIGIRSKSGTDLAGSGLDDHLTREEDHQVSMEHSAGHASADSIAVIASCANAFSSLSLSDTSFHPRQLHAVPYESESTSRSVLLLLSVENRIDPILVVQDLETDSFGFQSCTSWHHASSRTIVACDAVTSGDGKVHLVVCDDALQVSLINVAFDPDHQAHYSYHHAFQLLSINFLLLRIASVDLIGFAVSDDSDGYNSISVLSGSPSPGSPDESPSDVSHFSSSSIRSDSELFVSFEFLHTGFLDAAPSVVTFSKSNATLFSKHLGSAQWLATMQVSYKSQSPTSGRICCGDPRSYYSHLLPSILLVYTSDDETNVLRADWHPESFLAEMFASESGVQNSFPRIRELLHWLASEGMNGPEGLNEGPLVVANLPIQVDSYTKPQLEAVGVSDDSLRKVLDIVSLRCSELQRFLSSGRTAPAHRLGHSAFSTACEVPQLQQMGIEDLLVLRACCDIILDPPNFQSLDASGQHFICTATLFQKMDQNREGKENLGTGEPINVAPLVLVKTLSYANDDTVKEHAAIAASGCLAALLSNSQASLIEYARQRKLNWALARELRLPFWIRSDSALSKISEEIGQTIYRDSRDVMDSALFFVIAKKTRTLKNLAAADQSDNGRKLFRFLTSHDFASERGRRAAEKNAFSLLRKCRYREAAAFFLLAEPPSLNSALETIVTKLNDVDLAFLVARLVESQSASSSSSGPGISFGSVVGGGGGYASAGHTHVATSADDVRFQDWKPDLGNAAKKLLISRTLPMSSQDSPLSAAQLLWLGKREEASWCMSGILRMAGTAAEKRSLAEVVERALSRGTDTTVLSSRNSNCVAKARDKMAALIDFVSSPSLLKSMKASPRSIFASCLTVASALSMQGVEIVSLRTLLQTPTASEEESAPDEHQLLPQTGRDLTASPPAQMKSSTFGRISPPPHEAVAAAVPHSADPMESSIFASFDAPRPAAKPAVMPSSAGAMESSIFADFESPPKTKLEPLDSSSGGMSSSIFDSFDVPAQSRVTSGRSTESSAQGMASSIFDTYEVPRPPTELPRIMLTVSPPTPSHVGDLASAFDGRNGASRGVVTGTSDSSLGTPRSASQRDLDDVPDIAVKIDRMPTPRLWLIWRASLLRQVAARRLLREIATALSQFHGDPADPSISEFYQTEDPLVPSGASGMLQVACDAGEILGKVQRSLEDLSSLTGLTKETIVRRAHVLLGPDHQQHRTLFAVILHTCCARWDLAEHALRAASFDTMQLCQAHSVSLDHLVHHRKSKAHASSQFLRRRAARVSWQLETCLWLHRGGCLPLSSVAFTEAVVAVRVGLLVASWNHNHGCLEAMIRSDPDCKLDDSMGQHLWTSLKIIPPAPLSNRVETKKTSSGGWEFLVDCRRSEATQMLREKRTGTFLIRPHSGDSGVFTLSFKTNLVPSDKVDEADAVERVGEGALSGDELSDSDGGSGGRNLKTRSKHVKRDDVVQHAIIRLSESGYRCGSFGPYTTLISLLEAVSESLPFNLRFDLPPNQGIIKEEGSQPSPNAVFLRKLALSHADSVVSNIPEPNVPASTIALRGTATSFDYELDSFPERSATFGVFLELLVLSAIRRQLSSVIAASYEDDEAANEELEDIECLSTGSSSVSSHHARHDHADLPQDLTGAFRQMSPLLAWCRSLELLAAKELAPNLATLMRETIESTPVDIAESGEAFEAAPQSGLCTIDGGDALLRKMIQRDSGVEFSTLRFVDSGDCTIVVIFSQKDTIDWLVSNGVEDSEASALARLHRMEKKRVIEAIDMSKIKLKTKEAGAIKRKGIRYRILDPWEVEALHSWEGETLAASIGRERFLGFNLGKVGLASEAVFRTLGGLPLLTLWTSTKGGVVITKALATVHPPWERGAGGDLHYTHGVLTEPTPYINGLRQYLYRNALFRRLAMPQRFLALVQVELLDLKNLTAPGGSLSMSVYALLRLKRDGAALHAALTNKARTLDTAATQPVKLGKSTGPNAPASWGSVVRFRFPLPEQASVDGVSFDPDREQLFRGPPMVLQVSVYEKKLLVDHSLGTADIRVDGLWAGGQLEEWVPLRSEKHGISWFARIRLTLRFELMCLATSIGDEGEMSSAAPSVGLRKIMELSHTGGASAHEDVRRSVSSPDLLTYFESMVY